MTCKCLTSSWSQEETLFNPEQDNFRSRSKPKYNPQIYNNQAVHLNQLNAEYSELLSFDQQWNSCKFCIGEDTMPNCSIHEVDTT